MATTFIERIAAKQKEFRVSIDQLRKKYGITEPPFPPADPPQEDRQPVVRPNNPFRRATQPDEGLFPGLDLPIRKSPQQEGTIFGASEAVTSPFSGFEMPGAVATARLKRGVDIPLSEEEEKLLGDIEFFQKRTGGAPIPPMLIRRPARAIREAIETPAGQTATFVVAIAAILLTGGTIIKDLTQFQRLPEYKAVLKFAKDNKIPKTDPAFKEAVTSLRTALNLYRTGAKEAANEIMVQFRAAFAKTAVTGKPTTAPARLTPTIVPRGSQAFAMAQGTVPGQLTKVLWDSIPVAQRVVNAQLAGLAAQVGSKSWEALTSSEKQAFSTMQPSKAVTPTVEPVVTPEEIAQVTVTARATGAVGAKAITPKFVGETSQIGETILDFGSGKTPIHTNALREQGFDVTAFDVGTNVVEGVHDANALEQTYDTVFASNVINVAPSENFLRTTLSQIQRATNPNGRAVFNYPVSPRKLGLSNDGMLGIIKEFFPSVERVGGTSQAPLWEAKPPPPVTPPTEVGVAPEIEGIAQDVELLRQEQLFMKAIGTEGSAVRHTELGWTGYVVKPTDDPTGKVLVRHEFEGRQAERWYDVLKLESGLSKDIADIISPPITPFPEVAPEAPPQVISPAGEVAKEIAPDEEVPGLAELSKMYDFWRNKVKTLEETKTALAKYVRENLPPSVRGKFVTSVAKVKTEAQLETQMMRVREVAEQSEKRRLRGEITKEFSRAVVRKEAGIIKGRFGGEVQAEINAVRQALTMSKDEATAKQIANIKAYDEGTMAPDDMFEQNNLLGNAGLKEQSLSELRDTLTYIKELKESGRSERMEQLAKFKEKMASAKGEVQQVLTGGSPLVRGKVKEFSSVSKWFKMLDNGQIALTDFMDKLSFYDKVSGKNESALNRFVDDRVSKARNAENEGLKQEQEAIQKAFADVFKSEKPSEANNILRQMGREEISLGTFKDLDGEAIELKMTKGQMIEAYNLMQAAENLPTFSTGNRWTQEMMTAVKNELSTQEKTWADWMMTHLADYWASINEVYEPLYGVNLGRHKNYWPRNRDIERGNISEHILLKQDFDHFASVRNGSLKARTENKIPFEFRDANTTLLNHITQMEHFKAWATVIRDMRSLFMDTNIRASVRQFHGRPILKKVDEFLNDLARGGIDKAKIIHSLDKLRGNVTVSLLGFKPGPSLKQPASLIAYATEMPYTDFVWGINDFLKHPVRNYRILREKSAGLRARYEAGQWERDIKVGVAGGVPQSFSGKKSFREYQLTLIRLGDKYSQTVPGMWAKYQSGLKAGLSDAQAILGAEQTTNRTQVASYLETLSAIQRGGSIARLATMFQDQPNKYYRLISSNFRNARAGRISKKRMFTNIFILWVLAPALFQFMSDGFRWKKERQARAWALGPINNMLVIGQIAQSVFGWMQGDKYSYEPSPVLQIGKDVQRFISRANRLYEQGIDPAKDISMDDVLDTLGSLVKFGGMMFGLPTPYAVQVGDAVRNKDPRQIIWSEYALREATPVEKFKEDIDKDLEEYAMIPSNPDELRAALRDRTIRFSRSEYRERNPEVDAKLFISGGVTTVKTSKAATEVRKLVRENKIPPLEIRAVKAWQEDEERRRELGLKDESLTLTDFLIRKLLGITNVPAPTPPAQSAREPVGAGAGGFRPQANNPFKR